YQENAGLPGARNTALAQAKGKYIQLLDADDLLEQDKLRLQVELMEANTNISLVYSNILLFQSEASKREFKDFILPNNVRPSGKNEVIINDLVNDTFFLPGCVIFRKEVYEKVGKFNESLYGLEDWNYWFRAALLGFEFYSDDRVGTRLLCRDHEANMSKAYVKMLNARIQSRMHIMHVTQVLKSEKKLKVSNSFIDSILRKHKLLLLLDQYEYHFHFGSKYVGLKSLVKYSYYSKKPFYIFKRIKIFLDRKSS
ncbi:MAG: glycosyltransferase family 2 protein, partial [Rickettsiales bacterium]